MKYAIISLGGSIMTGLSTIADAMPKYSSGEVYAVIGCIITGIGLFGVFFIDKSR